MELELTRLFDDICLGHSRMKYSEGVFLYIKHLSHSDNRAAEDFYEESLRKLEERGVPNEKELLERAVQMGLWKKEEEYQKIKQANERIEESIPQLEENMAKSYRKQLDKDRETEIKLKRERNESVGSTAEDFARNEQNGYVVYNFFFKNKELTESWFEEPGEEDEEDFLKAIEIFIEYQKMFDVEKVKKLSLANFFQIYYPYVESPKEFFDIPASKMTVHQAYLLYYAHLFKNILQNSDVPDHIRDDPNAILNWNKAEYNKNKKERKVSNKANKKEKNSGGPEKVTFNLEQIAAGALEK